MQILPGWRNSQPLNPAQDSPNHWRWTLPVTPPDGPHSLWMTLVVRRRPTGAWEWEIFDQDGKSLWTGTGSATLKDAVTHACHQLTAQLGTPLTVLS
jgi:hypothetical protein